MLSPMFQASVVDFVRDDCGFTEFSAAELMRAVGIFLTNGVNQGYKRGHGLYPTFAFLSHRWG